MWTAMNMEILNATNTNAVQGTDCDDYDASNIPADTNEDGYSSCTHDFDDSNGNINLGMNFFGIEKTTIGGHLNIMLFSKMEPQMKIEWFTYLLVQTWAEG